MLTCFKFSSYLGTRPIQILCKIKVKNSDIRDPLNFMAKVSDKYWSDRCLKATLEYKRAGSAENAGHWCIARLQRQQL